MPAHWIRAFAALFLLAADVSAQTSSAPPASVPAPGPVVKEIVVTGSRPTVERRIDRTIYTLSNDLQAATGSAADVLGNLPSVAVDVDGNPSLRGDASVQILIDGRLAPEFNGANRGAALQQLGADGIERIEVITNPPANFKREGSAGIINIVTRRPIGARSASARANVGSEGRYNTGGSLGAQLGKLNLRGSATLRHDLRVREISDDRVVRDSAGATLTERRNRASGEDDRLSKSVSLAADYDVSDDDRLSAEGSYQRRDADTIYEERNLNLDGGGSPFSQYERVRRGRDAEIENSAVLRYTRAAHTEGDGVTVVAQRSETTERLPWRYVSTYDIPAQAQTFQNHDLDEEQVTREFSVDQVATLAADRKLVSGYDLQRDDYLLGSSLTFPVNAGGAMVPDPGFTNLFRYAQTIHALYGSYKQPFGRWTVLAGLRLEQTGLDMNQVTTGERARQDYFRAYPSLHVSHELNEEQTLRFSYSRRVFRPQGSDLNPFVVAVDPFALRQGNPDLKPSESDSVEAGWSRDRGPTSFGATLHARRSRNNLTDITTAVSPTVVLTSRANIGEGQSGGIELTATGRLLPQLDYNVTGNFYYYEIDAGNLGFAGTRSTTTFDTKAAITWRASPKDTLQLNVDTSGKRVTPQGYRRSSSGMNLGFRHDFRPNFSLSATISDLFESRRFGLVLDTPLISDTLNIQPAGRIVYLGVSWNLPSGKQKPQEKFEYD
jgi:outer membrane receptor protein involved in Fe transport